MRRRMDRARRNDDLTMIWIDAELGLAALDERLDADASQPVEHEAGHLRLGRDRQVRAAARLGIEIADRGRDTPIVEVRDRDREIPVAEFAVLVLDIRVPGFLE